MTCTIWSGAFFFFLVLQNKSAREAFVHMASLQLQRQSLVRGIEYQCRPASQTLNGLVVSILEGSPGFKPRPCRFARLLTSRFRLPQVLRPTDDTPAYVI